MRVRRVLDKPVALDIGLLVALVVLTTLLIGPPRDVSWFDLHSRNTLAAWVAVVQLASVLVRHRWPVVTFAVGLLGALAHLMLGSPPIPPDVVGLIGLYSVAAEHRRRVSLSVLGIALAAAAAWNVYATYADDVHTVVVNVRADGTVEPVSPAHLSATELGHLKDAVAQGMIIGPDDRKPSSLQIYFRTEAPLPTWGGFWLGAMVLLVVWAGGSGARRRRLRLVELHRQHETRARLAVVDERARISRELHDVVAHGLSVVVLQAQGAAAALEHRPERTRQALDAIVVTGRHALAEIRRLLDALGDAEPEPWAPAPGVARLPELCERVRATGLPVALQVDGEPYEPPTAVDLAAYRIVQEALTNVLKHAGRPAMTTVVLRYGPESLAVEVANRTDGTLEPHPTDRGTGLRGMRERASLLGGTFHAGPDPEGGFVVRATLPLEGPLG